MLMSVPKCAALTSGPIEPVYRLHGEQIPVVTSCRDLGVVVTPNLDFDIHITQVVKSANTVCNTIFRCFILKTPNFYINLYKCLVLPKLLYCAEVWRPYLKKHLKAIERVQSKLIKKVCYRCDTTLLNDDVMLKSISAIHDAADIRMYKRLCTLNNVVDQFVNVRQNRL